MDKTLFTIIGFLVGFVFTALISPHADWTISQVMKNQKVEVNKVYQDSIKVLNEELNYEKNACHDVANRAQAYQIATENLSNMVKFQQNEVEFYQKFLMNNLKIKAFKVDTLKVDLKN